ANAVNQVPANTWMSSNVADIKLDGGASSTGVVVHATSPNATIDVSATDYAKQQFNNLSTFTLFAEGDATVHQLEVGAVIVALSIVGAAAGGVSAGVGEVVDEAAFTTEEEIFIPIVQRTATQIAEGVTTKTINVCDEEALAAARDFARLNNIA